MLYYEPWVGKNYKDAPFSGSRLLLVGESSFERDFESQPSHLREDTATLAKGEFPTRYAGFWRYIQRSVTGVQTITVDSQREFWEGVALVNLIQRPMSTKHARPSNEDFRGGVDALEAYISELEPDGIIVYSKSAWLALIEGLLLVSDPYPLVQDVPPAPLSDSSHSYTASVFSYGSPYFLLLRHPSSRPKLRAVRWFEIISPFLTRVQEHNQSLQTTAYGG